MWFRRKRALWDGKTLLPGPALQCGHPLLEVLGLGIPGKLLPTLTLEGSLAPLCLAQLLPLKTSMWLSMGGAHFIDQLG